MMFMGILYAHLCICNSPLPLSDFLLFFAGPKQLLLSLVLPVRPSPNVNGDESPKIGMGSIRGATVPAIGVLEENGRFLTTKV